MSLQNEKHREMQMGKVVIKIPLVTWREGRPRYIASPKHRALGYKGEDLKRADGGWFTVDECAAWSMDRQREVERKEAEIKAGTAPASIKRQVRTAQKSHLPTLGQIVTDFIETDPRNQGKEIVDGRKRRKPRSANTVRFYRNAAAQLEKLDGGRFWNELAGAITPKNLETLLDRLEVTNGLATARGARTMLSLVYARAHKKNQVASNPVTLLEERLPVLEPRIRFGSVDEMKVLVAAADAIDLPEIGDSIVIGLFTAQRQGDRLSLEDGQITGHGILFRQAKKSGQPLLIDCAPQLEQRLKAARERRKEWRVNYPHVVLDETARRPFKADWYRKKFRAVREAAVRGVPDPAGGWIVEPCPSLADFRDQDLRDTAVTWLALAGCDTIHIASITGHEFASITGILKHYLGLHPELARTAIGALVKWYEEAES